MQRSQVNIKGSKVTGHTYSYNMHITTCGDVHVVAIRRTTHQRYLVLWANNVTYIELPFLSGSGDLKGSWGGGGGWGGGVGVGGGGDRVCAHNILQHFDMLNVLNALLLCTHAPISDNVKGQT